MYPHVALSLTFLVLFSLRAYSQDSISVVSKILSLPDKAFSHIDKENCCLEKKIPSCTDRYLNKLGKRKPRPYEKIWRLDSVNTVK